MPKNKQSIYQYGGLAMQIVSPFFLSRHVVHRQIRSFNCGSDVNRYHGGLPPNESGACIYTSVHSQSISEVMQTKKLGEKKTSAKGEMTEIVGQMRSQMAWQKRIDAMQLSIAKGEVTIGRLEESIEKELEQIRKNRAGLLQYGLKHASDYTELARLVGLVKADTEEKLAVEAKANAEKFINRNKKATDAQKAIVFTWYGQSAKRGLVIVKKAKSVLGAQEKAVKAEAQPAELEPAQAN